MDDQVFVWLTDADAYDDAALATWSAWLNPGELARCGRFVRPLRRRQFILGRALLRSALAELLAIDARSVVLQERPGNAPLLVHPAGGASFSIAHSGQWVACAVRDGAALGLDIEVVDETRPILALAEQSFGDEVARALNALPSAEQVPAFYAMWCRHEAQIKLGVPAQHTAMLEHAELAIAVCSAAPLADVRLRQLTLASG